MAGQMPETGQAAGAVETEEAAPESAFATLMAASVGERTWTFFVFRDVSGWRWLLRAPDGRNVARGEEGFATREDAVAAIETLRNADTSQAPIKDMA